MPVRGVTISGGSSKGAFAVGILQQLQRDWNVRFDLVSGTSTGALIAPFAVTGRYAQVQEFYSTLSTRAFLEAKSPKDMVKTGSAFGTDGLRQVVDQAFSDDLFAAVRAEAQNGKYMFLTAVNLQSAAVTHFYTGPRRPNNTTDAQMVEITDLRTFRLAALASASQPVLMPLIEIGGSQYGDGGVREVAPLQILVDQGVEELVGVVLTAENEAPDEGRFDGLVQTLKRTLSLMIDDVTVNDIAGAALHHQAVTYLSALRQRVKDRLEGTPHAAAVDAFFDDPAPPNPFRASRLQRLVLFRPQAKLLKDSLKFSQDDMRRMIRLGEAEVQRRFPVGGAGPFAPPPAGGLIA